jgi:hypothetical protein
MSMQPVARLKFANDLKESALSKIFKAYHKARGNHAKDAAAKKAEMQRLGRTYLDEDKFQPKWGECLLWEHENIVVPVKLRLMDRKQKRGRSWDYKVDVRGARHLDRLRIDRASQLTTNRFVFNDMETPNRLQDRLNELDGGKTVYLIQPNDKVPTLEAFMAYFPDLDEDHLDKFMNLSELEPPKKAKKERTKGATLYHISAAYGTSAFHSSFDDLPESGVYVPFKGHDMDPAFEGLMQVEWARNNRVYGLTQKALDEVDEDEFVRLDDWIKDKAAEALADPVVLSALAASSVLEEAKKSPLWSFCSTRADLGKDGLLDAPVAAIRALFLDVKAVPVATIKSLQQLADMGLVKLPKAKDFHGVVKALARAEKRNPSLLYLLDVAGHKFDAGGSQDAQLKGIVR